MRKKFPHVRLVIERRTLASAFVRLTQKKNHKHNLRIHYFAQMYSEQTKHTKTINHLLQTTPNRHPMAFHSTEKESYLVLTFAEVCSTRGVFLLRSNRSWWPVNSRVEALHSSWSWRRCFLWRSVLGPLLSGFGRLILPPLPPPNATGCPASPRLVADGLVRFVPPPVTGGGGRLTR